MKTLRILSTNLTRQKNLIANNNFLKFVFMRQTFQRRHVPFMSLMSGLTCCLTSSSHKEILRNTSNFQFHFFATEKQPRSASPSQVSQTLLLRLYLMCSQKSCPRLVFWLRGQEKTLQSGRFTKKLKRIRRLTRKRSLWVAF